MFDTFIIYITNETDLINCQNTLFEDGYKWKNSTTNEICKFRVPVFLFVRYGVITWTDEESTVYSSSSPKFSYEEYKKIKVC